jgi:tRNA(Ile)-lysidine synthase
MMHEPSQEKMLSTIKKYSMLDKGDEVLVGFSGGPDSTALLYLLKKIGVKIYALHIHHRLRDKCADEDEKFAVQTCKKWNVPVKTLKINVKKFAKQHKMSVEESARILRYEELAKEAKRLGCNKIALGHNANDNTETVVLNLARGAGLGGLAGIPPKRDNIIRPLFETTRKEILEYLKKHKISYCTDLSNIELGYRRNYVRHKIVPLLLEINPNLNQTILRTSEIIRTTNFDIIKMTKEAKKNVLIESNKKRVMLDIKKLLTYNLFIRREIIKSILPRLEFEQIKTILGLIDKPSGKKVEMVKDYFAWREYDKLILSNQKEVKYSYKVWNVNIGKVTRIPQLGLELIADSKKCGKIDPNDDYAIFDKSAISLPLSIRLRKPGDRFVPFKGKEKKLKEVLIDDKIPVRLRNRLPLLCDTNNILWIIGSRRSNFGLITDKTKEFMEVRVTKFEYD